VRGQERFDFDYEYSVTGRSLLLFELQREEEE
jgi:glycogen operon protein